MAGRWATVVLCVSEAERRRGEAHGVRGNWRVIPNGVDLAAFAETSPDESSAARLRLDLDERPVVVCVGRLCREKGQDVLLDAWPAVLERVPDAQLVLVGDGPDTEAMRRRARDGVKLVGKRWDVTDWLAAADVVAFPSRYEGMSVGMLEAMARGRAVVASDVGGAAEALGGEVGTLVPPEDPAALADAIAERLLDPVGAASAARAARRRAELYHDLGTTTATVAELYEELSSSTGPKPL